MKVSFVACAAAALALSSCAQIIGADENPTILPPSCKGTLYVRIASDFSGTATDIAIPYFFGIYDHLRYLNAHGGVMGCQIDVASADNNYTAPGTVSVVDGWRANDPHWKEVNTLFIFGTGPTTAVAPTLTTEQKVIIPGSYAGRFTSPQPITTKNVSYVSVNDQFLEGTGSSQKKSDGFPYVFFPATDYSTAIRLGIYAAWQKQAGRMAMAHADLGGPDARTNCEYCNDPLAAGKSYIATLSGMSLGRDLIFYQTSSPNDAPAIEAAVLKYVGEEVAHVKAQPGYSPVRWFWSGNSVYATSVLAASLWKAQTTLIDSDNSIPASLRQTWKLRVMANNWGIGETAAASCGVDSARVGNCNHDNFYGLFPVPRFNDLSNSSGMSTVVAHHQTYSNDPADGFIPARTPSQYADVRYVQGYASALMWERGIIAAINAGHRTPTGADLKTALEAFRNDSMDGVTAVPISFTAQDHRPQSGASVYKVGDSGQLEFVAKLSVALADEWLGY